MRALGGVGVAWGWSGKTTPARTGPLDAKNGNVIEALVPKTSAALMFDTMAIPADAPHPNNAHLWINYILRPEVHASLTNKVFYANPNAASVKFVRKDIANNKTVFLSDEDKKRMTPPEAVPADIRRNITRIYTKFKTGV